MKRPRVLHVFKTAEPETLGGAPRIMSLISSGLRDHYDSSFLIASNKGAAFFETHSGQTTNTVRHFGHLKSNPIAPTFPVRLWAIDADHDLIVLHAPFPLADLAGYLGSFRTKPVVIHWHADVVGNEMFKFLYSGPMRRSLKRAHSIVVSGQPLIDSSKFLGDFQSKCRVIPFGLDPSVWNELPAEDLAAAKRIRTEHPRLVLAVGRLVSYKGFHILIDAMNQVDGELWIAGRGTLRSFLEKKIQAGAARDRIRLLGEVSHAELRQLYHSAQVFCLPPITDAETFGLVQLEAMSSKLPVINTRLATMVPHIARDMLEGLTVPPNDPAALAAAINRLLDEPDLRSRLGQAGYARATSAFREDVFLDRVKQVYDSAIAGKPAPLFSDSVAPGAVANLP